LFFSLFTLHGGQSDLGAMLIWPRVVCGSAMCRLAHPGVCFFQAGRSWRLVEQEPSWVLRLMWSGDAMCGLGVWRCHSFASSWWFFPARCISSISSRFYCRKYGFCFTPLITILESSGRVLKMKLDAPNFSAYMLIIYGIFLDGVFTLLICSVLLCDFWKILVLNLFF
jgi:hypothetical protein